MATNNATNTSNPITVAQGGIGVSTLTTAYGVLTAGTTATGAVQTLSALGASGTILTSNGAAALPSFQAAAGGSSALTKIATVTASASATVSFAAGLSSTYDNYLIIIENMLPATDGVYLQMVVGTGGGPTYQNTGYSGLYAAVYGAGTTYTMTANNTTSYYLSGTASSATNELIGSNTTETGSWQILISGINTANDKTIMHSAAYYGYNSSRFDTIANGSGRWQGATVLTSLQFSLSSGNITSGTFKLYGYQN